MTATGVWVSLGTRMLISTINCPVLVRTALCSMAHSSAASRLALVHRATQPGAAGAFAGAASANGAAGAGCVACAARGGVLALGVCWAWLGPSDPNATATTIATCAEIFIDPAPKRTNLRMCRYAFKVKSLGGLLDRTLLVRVRFMIGFVRSSPAGKGIGKPVEIEIHHRRIEQCQRLADDQAADHRIAERLADFRAGAGAEHQRHAAEQGRHRRHHDGAESQQPRLPDP